MLQSLGQVYDSAVMIHTTFEFININCLLIPQSLCVRHSLVCGNEMTPIGQILRIKLDQIKQSLLLKVNLLVIFFRNISLFDDWNSFPHPLRASTFSDDDSKHHNEDKYSTAQCGCNNFFKWVIYHLCKRCDVMTQIYKTWRNSSLARKWSLVTSWPNFLNHDEIYQC